MPPSEATLEADLMQDIVAEYRSEYENTITIAPNRRDEGGAGNTGPFDYDGATQPDWGRAVAFQFKAPQRDTDANGLPVEIGSMNNIHRKSTNGAFIKFELDVDQFQRLQGRHEDEVAYYALPAVINRSWLPHAVSVTVFVDVNDFPSRVDYLGRESMTCGIPAALSPTWSTNQRRQTGSNPGQRTGHDVHLSPAPKKSQTHCIPLASCTRWLDIRRGVLSGSVGTPLSDLGQFPLTDGGGAENTERPDRTGSERIVAVTGEEPNIEDIDDENKRIDDGDYPDFETYTTSQSDLSDFGE